MKLIFFARLLVATALAGCSTLPNAGPTTSEIMEQASKQSRSFDFVEIDHNVVSVLAAQQQAGRLNEWEAYGKPPSPTIDRGDKVTVSIWRMQATPDIPAGETAGPAGALVIPDQTVADDGSISVPYAGRIPAAGRTPLQVQKDIEQRLADRVVEPQAVINITHAVSNSVTVSGEQVTGARVPLSARGDRLLDVIAQVGGAKSPVHQTSVMLSRNGQTVTIPMTTLVSDTNSNIYAWPGDVITIIQSPKKFMAFGATFDNKLLPFESDRLDLAQAIAKAGGLLDLRADPEGVFLFRFEAPKVVSELGIPDLASRPGGETPIVYHLNLRQVDGYFLSRRFAVADNDIIYVANARLSELQKLFTLIGTITAPVIGGLVVSRSVGH